MTPWTVNRPVNVASPRHLPMSWEQLTIADALPRLAANDPTLKNLWLVNASSMHIPLVLYVWQREVACILFV